MARIVFTYVVPFLLPMAIYASWVWYRSAYAARHGGDAPRLEQGPWPLLLFAGAVSALIVLAASAWLRGSGAGGVYVPAHVEDGKVIPGHFDTKKHP
jgi:hypothetical protein